VLPPRAQARVGIEALSVRQENTKGDVPHGCLFWCAKRVPSKAGLMEFDEGQEMQDGQEAGCKTQ
jgi:hypothetical protein